MAAMNDPSMTDPVVAQEMEMMRKNWFWFLIIGITLDFIGILAIALPLIPGLSVVIFLGILLLIGGAAELITAFRIRGWGGFFLHILAGILYLVVGVLLLERPGRGLVALTLILAIFLIVGGVFRIVVAVSERFYHWGWLLLSGIVSLLLGIFIWRNLFEASHVVIGVFVGIELIFLGMTWIMLAFALRETPASGGDETSSQSPPESESPST